MFHVWCLLSLVDVDAQCLLFILTLVFMLMLIITVNGLHPRGRSTKSLETLLLILSLFLLFLSSRWAINYKPGDIPKPATGKRPARRCVAGCNLIYLNIAEIIPNVFHAILFNLPPRNSQNSRVISDKNITFASIQTLILSFHMRQH